MEPRTLSCDIKVGPWTSVRVTVQDNRTAVAGHFQQGLRLVVYQKQDYTVQIARGGGQCPEPWLVCGELVLAGLWCVGPCETTVYVTGSAKKITSIGGKLYSTCGWILVCL